MESQPQNPEFRNNPENFHACLCPPGKFSCFLSSVDFSKYFFLLQNFFQEYHLSVKQIESRSVNFANSLDPD